MTDRDLGLIGQGTKAVFAFLKKMPPQCFIEERVKHQVRISQLEKTERDREVKKRMIKTEIIVIVYFLFYIVAALFQSVIIEHAFLSWITIIVLLFRLIDIVQVNVNISIFDPLEIRKQIPEYRKKIAPDFVLSFTRSIILASYNFIEIAVMFGFIYYLLPSLMPVIGNLKEVGGLCFADNFYYSFITQLTIGYGDITPNGFLKIISIVQATIAYFYSILIISRFLSLFPKISSNEEILRDE